MITSSEVNFFRPMDVDPTSNDSEPLSRLESIAVTFLDKTLCGRLAVSHREITRFIKWTGLVVDYFKYYTDKFAEYLKW